MKRDLVHGELKIERHIPNSIKDKLIALRGHDYRDDRHLRCG